VIACATASTYKGQPVDARTIRRKFGVRYVLEGSIEKIATRVRANVELVDTSFTSSLWADRFETELTDPFALQEAVTGRIAASLHLQLVRAENRRSIAERATDLDAYEMRLRAMAYLIDKVTPENTRAARRDLEKSVADDPHSAQTWAELADVLTLDLLYGWNNASKEVEFVRAEEALQKSYAISRSIALAHVAEGRIWRIKGDHQRALDAFNDALQLDPNLVTALVAKAGQLTYLGRAHEATALVEKAINLSPQDPDLGRTYFVIGRAYFATKDYDRAIQWLQKAIQLRPTTWFIRAYLISAYALTGRLHEQEAKVAVNEYKQKFTAWPLVPNIKDYYAADQYRDAHPDFRAMNHELLKGIEIAKQTADFP
jgi:adenylate cyclase